MLNLIPELDRIDFIEIVIIIFLKDLQIVLDAVDRWSSCSQIPFDPFIHSTDVLIVEN